MTRELKPKPEYSCEIIDEVAGSYKITKWSAGDLDEDKVYTVYGGRGRSTCDCYAGLSGKFCRHKQVLDIFLSQPEKIGGGSYYNYDRKHWS
jgi:hypothetical protein